MSKAPQHYIYGLHSVQSVLERAPQQVLSVSVEQGRQDTRLQQLLAEVERHGLALQRVSVKQLDRQLGEVNHQGVMAQVRAPRSGTEQDLLADLARLDTAPFILVLDGVQDPHNLGACLRSADGAGVHAVVVPRDRACGLTPVVSKVASGAAELMPFYQVTNLARCLRSLQEAGIRCVGLAGEAEYSLFESDLTGPLALVLGAEGSGLRRLTRETCDALARLPMHGAVESLNVSVSAGIALYEALRQRQSG